MISLIVWALSHVRQILDTQIYKCHYFTVRGILQSWSLWFIGITAGKEFELYPSICTLLVPSIILKGKFQEGDYQARLTLNKPNLVSKVHSVLSNRDLPLNS